MANLAYARFRNTLADLQDCENYIYDDNLSPEEHRARIALVKLCWRIAQDFEGIDDIESIPNEDGD